MKSIGIIAGKEFRDGLRNRWVVAMTGLLAALALSLAFLGSAPTGEVDASALAVTVVSLSSLTIFLVPLIALLLAYDAIVGEVDRGTMALLLTYPVSRWKVVIGKFGGHVAILAVATILGYGVAGVALELNYGNGDMEGWQAFSSMIGSSVLLGATFVSMGYLISASVRDRGMAGGMAVGVWLFFVLIYDMALLGTLVADQGRYLTSTRLSWLFMLNPADVYRLLNLTGFSNVSSLTGMSGLATQANITPTVLVGALGCWIAWPLGLATLVFAKRQL